MMSKGSRVFSFLWHHSFFSSGLLFISFFIYPLCFGSVWGGICAHFICSVWEEQSAFLPSFIRMSLSTFSAFILLYILSVYIYLPFIFSVG